MGPCLGHVESTSLTHQMVLMRSEDLSKGCLWFPELTSVAMNSSKAPSDRQAAVSSSSYELIAGKFSGPLASSNINTAS